MARPRKPKSVTWRAWGTRPGRHYQLILFERDTNIYIHHCGHPTALWPYYITHDAEGAGPMTLAPNGHGFRTLALAKETAMALMRRDDMV